MEEITENIILVSKQQEQIEFDSKFKNLSQVVGQADLTQEIPVDLDTKDLQFIKNFCISHNYDDNSISYIFPFNSTNLEQHIDSKSYSILKPKLDENDPEKNAQNLASLLQAGFYLEFIKFKKIINIAIQIPFFCPINLLEIQKYKEKWNITPEDLNEREKTKIIQQNKPVFQAIKDRYSEQITNIHNNNNNNQQQQN